MSTQQKPLSAYKYRCPDPIITVPTPIYQKENTPNYSDQISLLNSNSIQKPLFQQSCRSLNSEAPLLNTFKTQPGSTRNSSEQSNLQKPRKTPEALYKEHLFQTFQAMKFVQSLSQPDTDEIRRKSLWLMKRPGYENKRTVVFDLDETLVHCIQTPELGDFSIDIQVSPERLVRAGVNIRPYARELLASANKDFEVIVFTASHKCYADQVMNYLDPTNELIHHRLYRENCLSTSGIFIKDLRIFINRRQEDIIIVDNSAYCFAYQLEHGIPIISWFDDYNDKELFKLIEYLKILAHAPDICEVNRRTFHLNTFYSDYIRDYMKTQ